MRVQDSQGQVTMLNQQMTVVDNAIAEDKGKETVLEQGEQLLQMRINTLGYMALSYMKAEQKVLTLSLTTLLHLTLLDE